VYVATGGQTSNERAQISNGGASTRAPLPPTDGDDPASSL